MINQAPSWIRTQKKLGNEMKKHPREWDNMAAFLLDRATFVNTWKVQASQSVTQLFRGRSL